MFSMQMMTRFKIGVIVAVVMVASVVLIRAQTASSLQGVWRVTEIVVTGANAKTNKTPQPGLYIFTKLHYSIVSVSGTAPRADYGAPKDSAKLTDAEKIVRFEAWDAVTANSGTYQVSGTTVTTQPLVAKSPSVMAGPPATWDFRIEGKTLTLTQKSAAGPPASETRVMLMRVE